MRCVLEACMEMRKVVISGIERLGGCAQFRLPDFGRKARDCRRCLFRQ
jgi:hypothetical protein